MKKTLVALVASCGALTIGASDASAYVHHWGATSWPANTRLYDDAGNVYNPWLTLTAGIRVGSSVPEICDKAITEAGTLKSTTNHYCSYNTTANATFLAAASPTSTAYIYWNSGSYNVNFSGDANTN